MMRSVTNYGLFLAACLSGVVGAESRWFGWPDYVGTFLGGIACIALFAFCLVQRRAQMRAAGFSSGVDRFTLFGLGIIGIAVFVAALLLFGAARRG